MQILSMQANVQEVTYFSIGETENKSGIGVTTENYDYLTNSSGQDNLGQILLALLSFRKLSEEKGADWNGGVLLIDEIDSTLHPAAQNRLIDIMIHDAKTLNYQIMFTTHSISLLQYISAKVAYNKSDEVNNIELYYFTNANRTLEIRRNSDFNYIENDLFVQSVIQNKKTIKVYSEDAETRWFFKNLLSDYLNLLNILEVSLGCCELMTLFNADMEYFGNTLILLDADVTEKTLNIVHKTARERLGNVLLLPGVERPEKIMHDYLLGLPPEHPYWGAGDRLGFTWQYFNDNGPMSTHYQGDEREKYKKWFTQHRQAFDSTRLFYYWMEDNTETVTSFVSHFKEAYNKIANRLSIPRIQVSSVK
jgi:energy-coupling factor transporter ATP-binding protein EcfA2